MARRLAAIRSSGSPAASADGGRGSGVEGLVLPQQAERDLRARVAVRQHERCPPEVVDLDGVEPDLGIGGPPEGPRACLGAGGHRGHEGVVEVEHRRTVGPQRLDELALRHGDLLLGAELPDVGLAHVEDQRDVGRSDRTQLGEVADPTGSHLEQEVAGALCRRAAPSGEGRARC